MQEQKIHGSQFTISSTVDVLEGLFHEFSLFMENLGLDKKSQAEWRLIFIESTSNAVNHGGRNSGKGEVVVSWSLKGDEIWLEVFDEGQGPPLSAKLFPDLPQYPSDQSGRGIFIINKFSDRHEHWVSPIGYKQTIIKKHPKIKYSSPEEKMLDSTLEELSLSYESLTAFYKLGESLISACSISELIEDALISLKDIVDHDSIIITLNNVVEGPLIEELNSSLSSCKIRVLKEIELLEELSWEIPEEIEHISEFSGLPIGFACPIRTSTQYFGALIISRDRTQKAFGSRAINTIRTFSDLIGITIAQSNNTIQRNKDLRTINELDLAAEFQKKLIPVPQLKENEQWDFFAKRTSAKKVGGDYLDAYLNNNGDLYLIIADVMGKGLTAAFLAAMLRTAFLINVDSGKSVHELIHSLNQVIINQTKDLEIFATCCIARIPKTFDKIEIANAGHCSPLLFNKKDLVYEFNPTGPPLGLFEDSKYTTETIQLKKSEELVMLTDGLYEWKTMENIWGWANLVKFIPENLGSPQRLWDALQDEIRKKTISSVIEDDQALLYWKRKE